MPAAEMKFWGDESVFTKLPESSHGLAKRIQATLAKWKNVRQIEGGAEAAPGIGALPAFGHTPGHTVYAAGSGSDRILVLGDIANLPALFVRNPGWHATFDVDAQLAETNRRKMLSLAVEERLTVTGYHFGMPGAGKIAKDGNGYVFVPVVPG